MTDRRFAIIAALLSAGIGAAVMIHLRDAEAEALRAVVAQAPKAENTVAIPSVARVLRAMRLITVEIDTGVQSSSANQSWRGDVAATVVAPARFYYGVDLSELDTGDVWRSPLTGGLVVRVPEPRRLAVEVFGQDEKVSVHVGGTRLRDVAGEYHLGLARTGLHERAKKMILSAEENQRLKDTTREQIARLVRALAGPEASVTVEFVASEGVVNAGGEGARP